MATTVRKVKQENRLRRQNHISQDEESLYKPVSPVPPPPPTKPPPNESELEPGPQQRRPPQPHYPQQQLQQQQPGREAGLVVAARPCAAGGLWLKPRPPPAAEREPPAPDYRMPPLYGEEQSSNQQQQQQQQQPSAGLQTHSSKFPIEREVVLSLGEKNSKIPILHEYKQRTAGRVAIAPDAPIKQQAWVHEATQLQDSKQETRGRTYQSSENYSTPSTGTTSKPTKLDEEKTKSLSRTYHTIKDMISSRFGPNRKDVEPENGISLNNVAEELKKSSRSINEEEIKIQETAYLKARTQDPPPNMQQYPKNAYGQYGHSYGYQSGQQNVPLPGQLQSPNQLQPSLPSGQSAQLHVTHHAPPGGIQTVHQTQITAYAQSTSVIQNSNRDYVMQSSSGMTNQVTQHSLHQTPSHNKNQVAIQMKHPMQPPQQSSSVMQSPGQNCQSSQQIVHQNQHHQSPRFSHQHAQNMHQRQLIQQMQQQQQNSVGLPSPQNALRNQHSHFSNSNGAVSNYQQYQQSRQALSRSQIDLPSTSRQMQDLRIPSQDVYYHYNQNRSSRFGTPQAYSRNDNSNHQETEFQRRNSGRGIEKALSQPQLSYDDGRDDNDNAEEPQETTRNGPSESIEDKEKYEISVEEPQTEQFSRNGSRRTAEEYRPETSFGIRTEEARSSLRKDYQLDRSPDGQESTGPSIQKRIEELRKKSETENCQDSRTVIKNSIKIEPKREEKQQSIDNSKKPSSGIDEASSSKRDSAIAYNAINKECGPSQRKDDIENGIGRLKLQNQGSGSDYDKTGQSSSNVDSGRGSAVYSSGRRLPPEESNHVQGQDAEWVDIVESELRSILEPKDVPTVTHSTLSDSVSSVTPPLPPLTPQESPRTSRSRFSASLPYGVKPNYGEYIKGSEKRNYPSTSKHRNVPSSKKETSKKFSHLFGAEAGDFTSTTTGLDLDSMLDRSDSDISTNDARTIRKQLEGLENMYSEVLKLLGGSTKKRRKTRGLASYGSVSSLPTSSVSSRPIARHHDKRRSHTIDDRMKKAKDVKSINKRFQRLETHVVTLARSVAHLSSEMRTQHLMIQEMENIRGEISALRTQTNMAMVRSQSTPVIKDSELPALSNPSRVKKLTKFFGTEPPLIRLFLRELGYEKYAAAFEKERVGMVELPYMSEERLQKMGVPLGPRLRILQEARISVCKDPVYVV